MANLNSYYAKISTSSALNNMFKGDGLRTLNNCWTSKPGRNQWILVDFSNEIQYIQKLELRFQGGFVGQSMSVWKKVGNGVDSNTGDRATGEDGTKMELIVGEVELEDTNDIQVVDVNVENVLGLKLCFPQSTDFYGRITLYEMNIIGRASL